MKSVDIDTQIAKVDHIFLSQQDFCIHSPGCVNPAGSQGETTQRTYVPINTNLGRGQRLKVMGLMCSDPRTAGQDILSIEM